MRNMILAGLALASLAAAPAAAAAEPAPALMLDAKASVLASAKAAQRGAVRVWVDNHRDFFRTSDRLRVRVRSDYDGYLAVFHVDTNGDVDILWPRNEYDDGWVEGGRTLTLGSRGRWDYLNVRGGHGVGYVMAVALDEPLELWRVHDLYGRRFGSWDNNYSIYGDPFYAMDEIVRAVVPENAYGYESVDYYTYHMGRRYEYPRYACYDGFGDWYYDTHYSYYGRSRCDRVRVILVNRPWYYDTYRWRGSRRVYYDRYYYRTASRRPLHGYKERTDTQAPPARSSTAQRRPGSANGTAPEARTGGVSSRRPESTRPTREGTVSARPESGRTREGAVSARRPESGGGGGDGVAPSTRPERGTYEPRVRDRGEGRGTSEPRATRPDRATAQPRQPEESAQPTPRQDRPVQPQRERPTFQRRPERSETPRRESPPQRAQEPRRESPPQRSAEPRRESPPQRSSPPARSSEPRRESSPPARSSGGSRTRPSES